MKKKLKRVLWVVPAVLMATGAGFYIMIMHTVEKGLSSLVYENVDMSLVEDGTYYGEAGSKSGVHYRKDGG